MKPSEGLKNMEELRELIAEMRHILENIQELYLESLDGSKSVWRLLSAEECLADMEEVLDEMETN